MKVDRVPIDDPQWTEFADSHPDAGPFHLPQWAGLIAECYGFDAFAIAVSDSAREIIAGMPVVAVDLPLSRTRWVSLPFTDHCPLLVRDGADADEVSVVINDFVLGRDIGDAEVRTELPLAPTTHAVRVGSRHVVALPADPSDLHIRKNHRNARNRAQRRGIRVTRGCSAADVETYYRLHTLTRRRLGVPVQPRRFFDLIAERMIADGHGFIAKAVLDGEVIAAGLYLSHNGVLVAKYGASNPAMLDTGAGYLVDWETLSEACVEGYHTLDFGRTDIDAEGLRLYKSGWGAAETPLVYTHVSRGLPRETQAHLGGVPGAVIRHSPIWVCRAVGEVFYRWAA